VDVRRIAQKYGGGGHAMASGVILPWIFPGQTAILSDIYLQINP
jgi:nanoRNase/pAp phosphatase (c-di-AMP/oligoRNAs hydrolase)